MTNFPRERRQFGRRTTRMIGWIRIKGRPRFPCTIANHSPKGALLQFDVPPWMPFAFDLVIDGAPQAVYHCETRHVSKVAVGVTFVEKTEVAASFHKAISEIEEWTGKGPGGSNKLSRDDRR